MRFGSKTANQPLRAVSLAVLLPFLAATLGIPGGIGYGSGVAYAQEQKPYLGILPLARRGDVGVLASARIEEYMRAMLEAGGSVRLLTTKTIDLGKASGSAAVAAAKDRPASPALKALDKADTLAVTGRTMLEEGEDTADALKLLAAAIDRYEKNFVELADFTKLVDAYAQAASASLALKQDKDARAFVTKALTIQPTFVVDARKANQDLQALVTTVRDSLQNATLSDLTVTSNQQDAEVFVDGVRIGTPPATARGLLPGDHYVQVRKDTATPWGQVFTAKGRPQTVNAYLVVDDPTNEIEVGVQPDDIKAFASTGKFHEKVFKNMAYLFSKQVRADYLLFGVVARSPRSLELHLFLFSAQQKKVVALEKVDFNPTLSDMQMKMLDAEGRVRAAVTTWPLAREVLDLPIVYGGTGESTVAPPEIVPEPEPEPEYVPPPKPKPVPEPEPEYVPPPKPKPVDPPKPAPETALPDPEADPYAGLLGPDPDEESHWYSSWWFWTTVGVVAAAGGGTGAYFALRAQPTNAGFKAVALVP